MLFGRYSGCSFFMEKKDSMAVETFQSLHSWSFFAQDVHAIHYVHGVTSANVVRTEEGKNDDGG